MPTLTKLKNSKLLALILGLLILGELVFMLNFNEKFHAWYLDVFYNRIENNLDCESLPFYATVEKQFKIRADLVKKVKSVPGVVDFYPEQITCKIYDGGLEFIKGDAALIYSSRSAKNKAREILGKDFMGLPYRGEKK